MRPSLDPNRFNVKIDQATDRRGARFRWHNVSSTGNLLDAVTSTEGGEQWAISRTVKPS